MLFEYRYFGATEVGSTATASSLSFAPDLRRQPTYLTGKLRRKLPFRETISALHAVVTTDLRFKAKDRTEYLAWRAKQDELDLAAVATVRRENREQITALTTELEELRRRRQGRWSIFATAKKRFFDFLYKKNFDAWLVLDPVITVHPDEVAFECFSLDEASYGRLACSHEVFERMGEVRYGTTNVDYSYALYDEFQKIRDDKETTFQVDPAGFEVQTGPDEAYREVKIDLPDSWVRGFLQVGAAMALPGAVRLQLHPMDVHNLCFVLRRKRERTGPRSLRFLLEPGRPVRVRVEPFGFELDFPRSSHDAASASEVRLWGRRRLLSLERLIPVARRFVAVLMGTGLPSFWIADCGDLTFTLGLSGWTANDWAGGASFDLLAPRAGVDAGTAERVMQALRGRWLATPADLAAELGLDRGVVESALVLWAQQGRTMYDLSRGVWRLRELSRDPLPLERLRFTNEREEEAMRLVDQGVHASARLADGRVHVQGRVGSERPSLVLDADQRMAGGECTCSYHFRNKLRMGPCAHLLALRLAHERRRALPLDVPLDVPLVERRPEAPEPVVGPRPATRAGQVVRRAVDIGEAERFVDELLLERGLVELAGGPKRDAFVGEVARVLLLRGSQARAQALWSLLERHPAVGEFYVLDQEDLVALFEEWG